MGIKCGSHTDWQIHCCTWAGGTFFIIKVKRSFYFGAKKYFGVFAPTTPIALRVWIIHHEHITVIWHHPYNKCPSKRISLQQICWTKTAVRILPHKRVASILHCLWLFSWELTSNCTPLVRGFFCDAHVAPKTELSHSIVHHRDIVIDVSGGQVDTKKCNTSYTAVLGSWLSLHWWPCIMRFTPQETLPVAVSCVFLVVFSTGQMDSTII